MTPSPFRSYRPATIGTCLLFFGGIAACGRSNDSAVANSDTAGAVSGAAVSTPSPTGTVASTAGPATAGDLTTSGQMSADQEFLQKMSDHHEGLILMVHKTLEHTGPLAVKDEAKKLDSEQDDELDRMKNALKGDFNVASYTPKAMPEHQAMADSLGKLSGSAYDRQFRKDVITHHQEAVAMIDRYLPRLTHADVKTMAERMRANEMK
ncbi:MAG: DUF305 domain-containing protein [Gemmatimonadaceae bacterium]